MFAIKGIVNISLGYQSVNLLEDIYINIILDV